MRTGAFAFAISLLLAACSDGGGDSNSLPFPANPSPTTGGTSTGPITFPVQPIKTVTRYSVTFLPSDDLSIDRLPDHPSAINNKGEVVGGFYSERDGGRRAFLYTHGKTVDLGTLGRARSRAEGINDTGQVVGTLLTQSGEEDRGFLYSNGVMVSLGTLGGTYSMAWAVNASGDVAGAAETTGGNLHSFLYADGVMRDLGTLGGDYSDAFAINSLGHVVGRATVASGDEHAFVYRNGTMEDITTLSESSGATDINDKDQVVGWTQVRYERGWYATGFFYSKGVMTPIALPSYLDEVNALAINNSGQVVGAVYKYEDRDFGFIWDPVNGMRNLNDLGDPIPGCWIETANDINNLGQIVGDAYCTEGNFAWRERTVGVLLTPVR